jgi:hypothetical protein
MINEGVITHKETITTNTDKHGIYELDKLEPMSESKEPPPIYFANYINWFADQLNDSYSFAKRIVISPMLKGNIIPKNSCMNDNINKLLKISELDNNWDYCGSKKIDINIISRAIRVITMLSSQPLINPTGRNSIQLEYCFGNDKYLEFEISEKKVMGLYMDGDEVIFEDSFSDRDIPILVKRHVPS